jgi:hypothetical protein
LHAERTTRPASRGRRAGSTAGSTGVCGRGSRLPGRARAASDARPATRSACSRATIRGRRESPRRRRALEDRSSSSRLAECKLKINSKCTFYLPVRGSASLTPVAPILLRRVIRRDPIAWPNGEE